MVKISKETIIRANEMSKRRPKRQYINDQPRYGIQLNDARMAIN